MAMVDYGALLRIKEKGTNSWNFYNKNKGMFMESSDTGYVCKTALHEDGKEYDIDGNYFVYAGDKEFLLIFYKGIFKIISNEKVLYSSWGLKGSTEEFFFDNLPTVKVSYLDNTYYFNEVDSVGTWEDYVRENWIDATGKEKLYELEGGKLEYKRLQKQAKRNYRLKHNKSRFLKERNYRFLATWEYKNKKYEVIFGYGIESNTEIWNDIKNDLYSFSEKEREIIDSWFFEKASDLNHEGNIEEEINGIY